MREKKRASSLIELEGIYTIALIIGIFKKNYKNPITPLLPNTTTTATTVQKQNQDDIGINKQKKNI